jgi:hypothetical protein
MLGLMLNLEATVSANPSNATSTTAPKRQSLKTKKQTHVDLIGQPIAPWRILIAAVSPTKRDKTALTEAMKVISPAKSFKPGHKRTMTPAPEPEPEPTFEPLKPPGSGRLGSSGALLDSPWVLKSSAHSVTDLDSSVVDFEPDCMVLSFYPPSSLLCFLYRDLTLYT